MLYIQVTLTIGCKVIYCIYDTPKNLCDGTGGIRIRIKYVVAICNHFNVVSHIDTMTVEVQPLVHAEISVIPIVSSRGDSTDSGMSKYIAKAYDAIRKIEGIDVVLTSMGTHIETTDFEKILKAIDVTHKSLRREGNVTRIITTIRIDDRKDKSATFHDRVRSVQKKL
jgi:uncharacterized protein (TIGR00106 family)